MKQEWLGDALDSFKADILARAFASDSQTLFVLPMRTDGSWSKDNWQLYEKIISGKGIKKVQAILKERCFPAKRRSSYFEKANPQLTADCNIFIDPDTGIETQSGALGRQRISIKELKELLENNSKRVLAIYQHRGQRKKGVPHLKNIINRVRKHKLDCIGYYGGNVSLVFVANRSSGQLDKIKNKLNKFHGSQTSNRVLS